MKRTTEKKGKPEMIHIHIRDDKTGTITEHEADAAVCVLLKVDDDSRGGKAGTIIVGAPPILAAEILVGAACDMIQQIREHGADGTREKGIANIAHLVRSSDA